MSHQQLTPVAPVPPVVPEKDLPAAPYDRKALDQLVESFAERKPLAVLVDEGSGRAGLVLDQFGAEVSEQVDTVRVSEPFLDSMTFMGRVISSLGFQIADLSLADLESIFRMFLSYQKTHSRRTVICIEEAQDQSAWVLDKMCQLIEFEEQEGHGLFVVLVGRSDLVRALTEPPMDALSNADRTIITVAPLALRETKELVRQCVESDGQHEIAQTFDFRAITRIHKLSAGVPDTIGSLCGECVQMLDKENEALVTPGLVNKAAESLGLIGNESDESLADDGVESSYPASGQLIVRVDGRVVQTLMVDKESILIGRDQRCDVCITSPVVSRQHALIVNSPAGVKLVDLGSTNGSIVNGERVERCSLKENEVIVIGSCRIEFVAADYGPIAFDTDYGVTAGSGPEEDSVFISEEQSELDEGTRLMAVDSNAT